MKQIPVSKIQLVDIQYQAHMDYIYNVESGDTIGLFFCTKIYNLYGIDLCSKYISYTANIHIS